MSVSLNQLNAMVDATEALSLQLRELIALRETVASQSVQDRNANSSTSVPRLRLADTRKPIGRRLSRVSFRALRSTAWS